ncbi:unnamed protein product [Somion occarium]|uniref:F-box domain-containing protein n=1 Tax=Somion occarium TaxID=3059160 RepID=A0ABP1CEX5_9APHY
MLAREASKSFPICRWTLCLREAQTCFFDDSRILRRLLCPIQVFLHLQPLDLLNLARTSRPFRSLLMRRSAASFWRAARQNVEGDFPECPSFMSEPAYANLCFSSHCHGCVKPNVQTVYWGFRARFCKTCKQTRLCRVKHYEAVLILPGGGRYSWPIPRVSVSKGRYVYRRSDIEAFETALLAVDESKRKSVFQEQTEYWEAVSEHMDECQRWDEALKTKRSEELQDKRDDRLEAILEKLREAGWEEEIEFMENVYSMGFQSLNLISAVRRPGALTERVWNNMLPEVTQAMNDMRVKREEHRFNQQVAKPRIEAMKLAMLAFRQEYGQIFPSTREFAFFPGVKGLLNAPEEVEITVESFGVLRAEIPKHLTIWKDRVDNLLREFIKTKRGAAEGIDPLRLAIGAYYRCKECGEALWYPNVLIHACLSKCYDNHDYNTLCYEWKDQYRSMISELVGGKHWDTHHLCFDVKPIWKVIEAFEMDPSRATTEDMDHCQVRLTCNHRICTSDGVLAVMTWRVAMMHNFSMHLSNNRPSYAIWKIVHPRLVAKAAGPEAMRAILDRDDTERAGDEAWGCMRCLAFDGRHKRQQVYEHLQDVHGAATPGPADVFYNLDSTDSHHPHDTYLIQPNSSTGSMEMDEFFEDALASGVAAYDSLDEDED